MPFIETISIVNKSGKVVSTSKHLINILKDAKDAYQEKKAEIRAEYQHRQEERLARKLRDVRLEEARSVVSSRHSHRHREDRDASEAPSRPALTEDSLSAISEGSVTSSRRSSRRSSRHGSVHHSRSPRSPRAAGMYRAPYFENADISRTELVRQNTDTYVEPRDVSRQTIPEYGPPRQLVTTPLVKDDIDMHLAYGDFPRPDTPPAAKEQELQGLMSKFDQLMIEAQCIQHSAATIISSLQTNPEAMAAVALTLAEISNLITKMGPSMLTVLKGSAPAIFALLASPQFLIATGVAVGVTVVMFGGYKIIKQIQRNSAEKKEASQVEEALVFDGELSSIETWRRGIADAEAESVATSVDGEFITPEAMRVRKERIRHRAREERQRGVDEEDHDDQSTIKAMSTAGGGSSRSSNAPSIRRRESSTLPATPSPIPLRRSSRGVYESYGTETIKASKLLETKPKKSNALKTLFKKGLKHHIKDAPEEKVRSRSHKPRLLEVQG